MRRSMHVWTGTRYPSLERSLIASLLVNGASHSEQCHDRDLDESGMQQGGGGGGVNVDVK